MRILLFIAILLAFNFCSFAQSTDLFEIELLDWSHNNCRSTPATFSISISGSDIAPEQLFYISYYFEGLPYESPITVSGTGIYPGTFSPLVSTLGNEFDELVITVEIDDEIPGPNPSNSVSQTVYLTDFAEVVELGISVPAFCSGSGGGSQIFNLTETDFLNVNDFTLSLEPMPAGALYSSSNNSDTWTFDNLPVGSYCVSVTAQPDACASDQTLCFEIVAGDSPFPLISLYNEPNLCSGMTQGIQSIDVDPDFDILDFHFNLFLEDELLVNPEYVISANNGENSIEYSNLATGNYWVEMLSNLDPNSCSGYFEFIIDTTFPDELIHFYLFQAPSEGEQDGYAAFSIFSDSIQGVFNLSQAEISGSNPYSIIGLGSGMLSFDWTIDECEYSFSYEIPLHSDSVLGCTDETACNYNPEATHNNATCSYFTDASGNCMVYCTEGCMDIAALNFNPFSNCPGFCLYLGDLNGDGVINSGDLNDLLAQFGCIGPDCSADFNNDGVVNSGDLVFILTLF